MIRALIPAAVSALALAGPALAQPAGPATAPAAETTAAPADASCPPEHAAMGHCTPKVAAPAAAASPAAAPSAPPAESTTAPAVDPACPPEHAAMGHCTPKSAAPAAPASPPAPPAAPRAESTTAPAGDPACPPEHAAMGHCTPKAAAPAPPPPPASDPSCPPEHAAMGHCTPKSIDPAAASNAAGTAAPSAPPVAPPPPAAMTGPEHAADTVWDPKLMAATRAGDLIAMHGGMTVSKLLLDRLEYRLVDGSDGYAWDGEAWYGGDYDKLWLKTEGEGVFGDAVEQVEVQALYSRAIDPWFNLQTGVRYDIRPRPDRAHLVVGIQGLAPYWFEVDGAVFLSTRGDVTARLEAEYDQRITNRLILQPRAEIDLAAQDVPELGIGAGLSSIEAGLRLRYEIIPEFAPYVGVQYERRFGDTADFARADGEDAGGWAVLVGLRSWF